MVNYWKVFIAVFILFLLSITWLLQNPWCMFGPCTNTFRHGQKPNQRKLNHDKVKLRIISSKAHSQMHAKENISMSNNMWNFRKPNDGPIRTIFGDYDDNTANNKTKKHSEIETSIPLFAGGKNDANRDKDIFSWENKKSKANKFLIYAKYRTGSTFTSLFLSKRQDIYFLFEPLKFEEVKPMTLGNELSINKWINQSLHCQFKELWERGLRNRYHTNKSLSGWRSKVLCFQNPYLSTCKTLPIDVIESKCRTYDRTTAKVILVPKIKYLEALLEDRVHVIHLVRDPRAMASSRAEVSYRVKKRDTISRRLRYTIIDMARRYCQNINQDLMHMKFLKMKNPDILYTIVRYEDLALHPAASMKKLFEDLGLADDRQASKWVKGRDIEAIYNTTNTHKKVYILNEKYFSTMRANSSATALGWKHNLKYSIYQAIEAICADTMALLNYTRIKHEHLLNESHTTFMDPFNFSDFPTDFRLKSTLGVRSTHISEEKESSKSKSDSDSDRNPYSAYFKIKTYESSGSIS